MSLPGCERPQSPNLNGDSEDISEPPSNVMSTNSSFSQPDVCEVPPDTCKAIGSDLWDNAERYDPDSGLSKEAQRFFDAIDWQVLASIATDYRDDIHCSYSDAGKFSVDQVNMVRHLDFVDSVCWVARVRLPPEATPTPLEHYNSRRVFDIEVASMKFLKSVSPSSWY